MRAHYKLFLQKNGARYDIDYKGHTFQILMPPSTKKMLDRISTEEHERHPYHSSGQSIVGVGPKKK